MCIAVSCGYNARCVSRQTPMPDTVRALRPSTPGKHKDQEQQVNTCKQIKQLESKRLTPQSLIPTPRALNVTRTISTSIPNSPSGFTFRGGFCCFFCLVACFSSSVLFLPDFENTALREVFALFQMLRPSSARVVSHFGFAQKTRRFSGRYSVVIFWLRLGPKLEKRGLRGVFLTLGNHVFCDSPLGAFCVFLSFAVFRHLLCLLFGGGGGVGGGA